MGRRYGLCSTQGAPWHPQIQVVQLIYEDIKRFTSAWTRQPACLLELMLSAEAGKKGSFHRCPHLSRVDWTGWVRLLRRKTHPSSGMGGRYQRVPGRRTREVEESSWAHCIQKEDNQGRRELDAERGRTRPECPSADTLVLKGAKALEWKISMDAHWG